MAASAASSPSSSTPASDARRPAMARNRPPSGRNPAPLVRTRSRFFVPGFDGSVLTQEAKDALRARFCTGVPERRWQSALRYKIAKRAGVPSPRGPESIRRPSRSGRGDRMCPTAGPDLPTPDPLRSRLKTRRPSLHRCLQRNGTSRLPDVDGDKPPKSTFKSYPIGCFHVDVAEVRTQESKLHLFVAIDRTVKFAFAELHEKATRRVAGNFLRALAHTVPHKIHPVLTRGTHFADPSGEGWTCFGKLESSPKRPFRKCH